MKFILTGCTGFIGGEVLHQCLKNPSITSVVALSRRDLPDAVIDNPKLKVILMKDFNVYDESVVKELSGADACIWCMGTPVGVQVLEIEYPLAFGSAFSKTLATSNRKFRYLHLSGMTTERVQEKSLWIKGEMRKMKGQAELNMLGFAEKEILWETLIVKPGSVRSPDIFNHRTVVGWLFGDKLSIGVDELAAYMIDAASNGWTKDSTSNSEMAMKGRAILIESRTEGE